MGKYIKLFDTHSDYNTYITGSDKVLPNVSYCVNENEVHYNPWVEIKLVCKYNITDTTNPTSLFNDSTLLNEVEIDGVVQPSVVTSYTFETTGVHTVKFRLNDSVTTLDSQSFAGRTKLVSITIPDSITSIGNAFPDCSNLTSVTIPNSVTSIGGSAFSGCSGLTSVSIPDSVTTIGDNAFYYCTSLTSVTIGNSVTTIGGWAFQGCSGLTSVTIPNSVTTINTSAFNGCSGLTSVIIGNSVTTIYGGAFYYCSNLTNITSLATTAPTLNGGTFQNVKTNGTLYVPAGSIGYDVWMGNNYLGQYNWTKVEQ